MRRDMIEGGRAKSKSQFILTADHDDFPARLGGVQGGLHAWFFAGTLERHIDAIILVLFQSSHIRSRDGQGIGSNSLRAIETIADTAVAGQGSHDAVDGRWG